MTPQMATRPRVKICGLRRRGDAALALELGAAALGCVLAPDSPRAASLAEARALVAAFGPRAPVVLVFRDASRDEVLAARDATGALHAQVHGASEALCSALEAEGLTMVRVFRVAPGARALPALEPAPTPERPALLDVGRGGSGQRFDWALLGERAPEATFVAGGVDAHNVGELVRRRPFGIDLSSGIERAPGIKDEEEMRRLFAAIEEACS